MRIYRKQSGLTLVDMLIAVSIIAVLTTIVLTIATSIQNKAAQQRCEGTLATINTALQQYRDSDWSFNIDPAHTLLTTEEIAFYTSLKYPPDCNEYTQANVGFLIAELLDAAVVIDFPDTSVEFDPNAVMCFFLSRIPRCRQTLSEIDKRYLVSDYNSDENYQTIEITTGGIAKTYPWQRVVDPWGNTLMYDYYVNDAEDAVIPTWDDRQETLRNFPLVTSAGPDGVFHTPDDITNREKTRSTMYKP